MRLVGKVVLITGAAGGIGQAACQRFVQEGARVCASDLTVDGASRIGLPASDNFLYVAGDVTRATDRANIIAAGLGRFGKFDVVFANHGKILGRPFVETSEADWDAIQATNLKSTYFLVQSACAAMSDGGSIILVSSAAGILARPNMSAYSASKAGIIMLARSLALDLSERGIRVNAIAPGLVDTPMPREFLKNLANKDQIWASMLEKSPLKRAATPEEIVGLAVYLASDESSYTTGAVIPVDGGRTAT
jgi:NAD(P)-dependent dehydrogenase (short-subunit alcohol dehydrogenase family)